jgi:hypothetical protein
VGTLPQYRPGVSAAIREAGARPPRGVGAAGLRAAEDGQADVVTERSLEAAMAGLAEGGRLAERLPDAAPPDKESSQVRQGARTT